MHNLYVSLFVCLLLAISFVPSHIEAIFSKLSILRTAQSALPIVRLVLHIRCLNCDVLTPAEAWFPLKQFFVSQHTLGKVSQEAVETVTSYHIVEFPWLLEYCTVSSLNPQDYWKVRSIGLRRSLEWICWVSIAGVKLALTKERDTPHSSWT